MVRGTEIKRKLAMSSNIEPLAREMTEHICRRNGMAEAIIYQAGSICIGNAQPRWLEAGVMDRQQGCPSRDRGL